MPYALPKLSHLHIPSQKNINDFSECTGGHVRNFDRSAKKRLPDFVLCAMLQKTLYDMTLS